MAKTQTYSEDLLVTAVIKYADGHSGKIKSSELAAWASVNIAGLEGVKYYHFTRPIQVKDPKTGGVMEKEKLCKQRLDEINKARSITYRLKTNVLLQSADIDEFLRLPMQVQRRMILDTRSQVDALVDKNINLSRTNKKLEAENKGLLNDNQTHEAELAKLKEKQNLLSKQVSSLIGIYGEREIRATLEEIGVSEEGYNLRKYTESLSLEMDDAFSIQRTIKPKTTNVPDEDLFENIMKGMDF